MYPSPPPPMSILTFGASCCPRRIYYISKIIQGHVKLCVLELLVFCLLPLLPIIIQQNEVFNPYEKTFLGLLYSSIFLKYQMIYYLWIRKLQTSNWGIFIIKLLKKKCEKSVTSVIKNAFFKTPTLVCQNSENILVNFRYLF